MLAHNLSISAAMIVICILGHSVGIYGLMAAFGSRRGQQLRHGRAHHRAVAVVLTVFGLLTLHALQISAYAWLYVGLGEFHDPDTALYFSATTFTTLGYGDVFLGPNHRLIAGIEGVIGLILIGWSTATLVSLTAQANALDGLEPSGTGGAASRGQDLP